MVAEPQDEPSARVRALLPDEERALAAFYARWSPFVYSLALRSLVDVGDAEEATRQIFTRAWTSGCTFEPDEGPVPVWLVTIAREQVEAVLAARGPSSWRATTPTVRTTDSESGPAALADQLTALDGLSRLDPAPRQALRMALHDNLDHRQIAERMEQSATDTGTLLRRGLEALRTRLEVQTSAR